MSLVVIRAGDSPEHIRVALDAARAGIESAPVRAFDSERHRGAIRLTEDPVESQRRIRDEWNERPR